MKNVAAFMSESSCALKMQVPVVLDLAVCRPVSEHIDGFPRQLSCCSVGFGETVAGWSFHEVALFFSVMADFLRRWQR